MPIFAGDELFYSLKYNMFMENKTLKICVKSGKKLGSVELFIYFCR